MTYRLWRRQCSNLGAPGKGVAAKPRGSRPPGPRGLTSLQAPLERFLSLGPFDVYFLPCSCLGLTVGMSLDPEVGVGTNPRGARRVPSVSWQLAWRLGQDLPEEHCAGVGLGLRSGPGEARLCFATTRLTWLNKGGGDHGSQRGSVSASRGSGFSTSLLQAGCIWGG